MATSLRPAPLAEPSTDFPTIDLVPPITEPERPRGTMALVLVVSGALLVGAMGFAMGRASAPVPAECRAAVELAERTSAVALDGMAALRDATMVLVDGELPEASAILDDANSGVAELRASQVELAAAADACLGA